MSTHARCGTCIHAESPPVSGGIVDTLWCPATGKMRTSNTVRECADYQPILTAEAIERVARDINQQRAWDHYAATRAARSCPA